MMASVPISSFALAGPSGSGRRRRAYYLQVGRSSQFDHRCKDGVRISCLPPSRTRRDARRTSPRKLTSPKRLARRCRSDRSASGNRIETGRPLGACLLNPGEMGFEPLKPVGEPDAANSRIRFDVRVEALRPSFVAPFPRWRSSAGCECGKGRGPPLGELQDIVGEADEAPLVGDLLDAAQEKLTEAARLLDLSEHRLGQLLS